MIFCSVVLLEDLNVADLIQPSSQQLLALKMPVIYERDFPQFEVSVICYQTPLTGWGFAKRLSGNRLSLGHDVTL